MGYHSYKLQWCIDIHSLHACQASNNAEVQPKFTIEFMLSRTTRYISIYLLPPPPPQKKPWGSVITLDSYYELDTWWELTCHQTMSNYEVILDHAHILFISEEKNAVGKIANPEQFLLVPGPLLLLQPRATTVVTRFHGGSRNSYL